MVTEIGLKWRITCPGAASGKEHLYTLGRESKSTLVQKQMQLPSHKHGE